MTGRTTRTALLVLGLTACGGGTDPLSNDDFAPGLGVDLAEMTQTASGLYLQDLTVGDGDEAATGTTVTVHYEGFLANGFMFDSSRERDDPLTFVVGAGELIPGFEQGVQGMRVGGTRKLVVPPDLAYGELGAAPVIPPNAYLVFDLELLAVEP